MRSSVEYLTLEWLAAYGNCHELLCWCYFVDLFTVTSILNIFGMFFIKASGQAILDDLLINLTTLFQFTCSPFKDSMCALFPVVMPLIHCSDFSWLNTLIFTDFFYLDSSWTKYLNVFLMLRHVCACVRFFFYLQKQMNLLYVLKLKIKF